MVNDKSRRRLPPYVSYRTFRNFLEDLQQGIPARIDRSYWGERLSGSTGTQLMVALRFLSLIDTSGLPTSQLRTLVMSKGLPRTELIRQLCSDAYDFLLRGSFDLETATYAQLEEVFQERFQLAGDVSRKCIKFFVAMATDAEMPLSSFITKKMRLASPGTTTRNITRRKSSRTTKNTVVPQNGDAVPDPNTWDKMLLGKFPNFDPSWSDEVKLNWFKAFDELLKRGLSRTN